MDVAKELVALLGTKHEAFGVVDAALILTGIVVIVIIELALASAVRGAIAWVRRRADSGRDMSPHQ